MTSNLFPKRLRSALNLRNLTQVEVAKRSGLQASAISHFMTGDRKPSFDNLKKLADALDITTDFLLGRVDDIESVAAPDRLHRYFDQLSSEDQGLAEDYLELLAHRASSKRNKG